MKKLFITFIVGVVCGGGGVWYAIERERSPALRDAEAQAQTLAEDATEAGAAAVTRAAELLDGKLDALELQAEHIREEMARTDRVVRQKARAFGPGVVSAASDARVTARVTDKLADDPALAGLELSVETTQGVVTLAGEVASTEQVGRAILLAYETADVLEVVSTLTVKDQP